MSRKAKEVSEVFHKNTAMSNRSQEHPFIAPIPLLSDSCEFWTP